MPIGRAHAISLLGLDGAVVEIEADISNNLPSFVLIGLPDAALGEARDRVRSAAGNSGVPLPSRKLTVNLSPAALPKHGSGFDLGIAMAALAADGQVSADSVGRVVHLGELGLDGRLRPLAGILPAVLAAVRAGFETVVVPAGNADEASLVPGVRVVPVVSLRDAAIWHGAGLEPIALEALMPTVPQPDLDDAGDLADVIGNPDAVEAMQVAAAGGHHVYLLGPPGAGKTMLAARLPGLLPELTPEQALEVASIRSLAGIPVRGSLSTRPPLEAPHHTASAAAIVGGGSGVIRPGAAARAAHGVLFLDEAPEFAPAALDALRQPLESGVISISRATATARFPARFQLVLAANPCPCGNAGTRDGECRCTPFAVRRYLGRLSGPLLDRVDIRMDVHRITAAQLRTAAESPRLDTASARRRILAARGAAAERLRGTPWRVNAHVAGAWLRSPVGAPAAGATASLDRALERGGITMRGYDRVLRLAWTLCDLDGASPRPDADHIGRALLSAQGRTMTAATSKETPVTILGLAESTVAPLIRALVPDEAELDRDAIADRFARAAWSGISEPGDRDAGHLVATLGAEAALASLTAVPWPQHRPNDDLDVSALEVVTVEAGDDELSHQELVDAVKRWRGRVAVPTVLLALRQAARFGVALLVPGDANWPIGVDELGEHAPHALWVRGDRALLGRLERSIAVVGARAATGYGEHVTIEAASGLTDRGFTIVSGAAYGIDGIAHRAALASSGPTVAFLAGGVDRFYPAGHEALLTRIVERGAVVSEVPPGTAPTKWRFLQRNRLIAAASRATVVVEAGWRSGSLNTAGHAATLGRPVGAVPGPVTSAASAGCHRLLRETPAILVTNADEMAELVPSHEPVRAAARLPATAPTAIPISPAIDPTGTRLRLLDALNERSGRSVDRIAALSGLAADRVRAELGLLELEGIVHELPAGWTKFSAKQLAARRG